MHRPLVWRRFCLRLGSALALLGAVVLAGVADAPAQAAPLYLSCPSSPCPEYTISGVVYGEVGGTLTPLKNVFIHAQGVKGRLQSSLGTAMTDSNGAFTLTQARPGNYVIRFADRGDPSLRSVRFGTVWSGGSSIESEAAVVTVSNAPVNVGTIVMPATGSISGSVTNLATAGAYAPIWALINPTTGQLESSGGFSQVNSDGTFVIRGLTGGDYLLKFVPRTSNLGFGSHYWRDTDFLADAEVISVTPGVDTPLPAMAITATNPSVTRITGSNRFETAVKISQLGLPEVPVGGIPFLFVVNGLSFPDALSAGPAAAAMGGVVLLVHPQGIPEVVAAEIARLDPQKIIVIGGPTMVSDQVRATLATFAPTDRWTGSNRYETSALIARNAFAGLADVDTAYLTTGVNFPDALSIGPRAGLMGRPVLLVAPGASLGPAAPVLAELGVTKLVILGGETTVSSALQDVLDNTPSWEQVVRVTGSDRYSTSVAVSQEFRIRDAVFIASGTNFPDALAVSWLAAAWGSPVVLAPQGCIPQNALNRLVSDPPRDIFILGGPTMLSAAVEQLTPC